MNLSASNYLQQAVRYFFFGNFFYGFCAVALSVEALVQQGFPMVPFQYLMILFPGSVLFYNLAYLKSEFQPGEINERNQWYAEHQHGLKKLSWFFFAILAMVSGWFLKDHFTQILQLTRLELFLLFIFPALSFLYYGAEEKKIGWGNLRRTGWLKPFIIGLTWAGLVTVYPVLFYDITHSLHYEITLRACLLTLKNTMFISVLCILFDIKDYATDYNQKIKTFAVRYGLRKTIFLIIIPLTFLGVVSFVLFAFIQHFSTVKILLNLIPFTGILGVAYGMKARRSIFYYLVVIDGLMLLKALCGTLAMTYF